MGSYAAGVYDRDRDRAERLAAAKRQAEALEQIAAQLTELTVLVAQVVEPASTKGMKGFIRTVSQ